MTVISFNKRKKPPKRPTAPAGLSAKFKRLYQDLVAEKVALSGAVTDADLEMIGSATLAAQGEATCRQIAAKLLKEGRSAGYMTFSKQRDTTDKSVNALAQRLEGVDGNALLKSAAVAIGQANLAALREHAESILLRKSKIVDGADDAPAIVRALTE